MNEYIYVIYDTEAEVALKPCIISRNDVQPTRELENLVNNPESIFHRHSQHYELRAIGVMNLETLEVAGIQQRTVARAIDLKTKD